MVWRHHILASRMLALALVAGGLWSGCARNSREAPAAQQVQDAITGGLPAHFTLLKLEQEPLAAGPETVKVNFKATVEIAEDLYVVEREADGLTKVTLLKLTQPSGAKVALYGHLLTHRLIDQWILEAPQFQKDFRQFGKPRGAFGAQAYPADSAEAHAALRRQVAEKEQMQQLQQAVSEQQERARIAREEKQMREEQERKERIEKARLAFEAQNRQAKEQHQQATAQREQVAAVAHQRLLAVTAPGTRYLGTRTGYNGSTQRLALVFLDQQGERLRAEASNPDDQKEKRTFSGELRFNAQPETNGAAAYTIVLHGLPSNKINPERNSIYERSMDLKLYLTAQGLDGIADASLGDHFPIHLQREDGSITNAPVFPSLGK